MVIFGMLNIILPSAERTSGEVIIFDYLTTVVNENNLRAKIRWNIFIGIYIKNKQLFNNNIYMGITYMSLDGFELSNKSADNKSSPLDRGVVENTENCKQNDRYNCGVFYFINDYNVSRRKDRISTTCIH